MFKPLAPFTISSGNVPIKVESVLTEIKQWSNAESYLLIKANLANGDLAYVEIFYTELDETAVIDVSNNFRGDFGYQINNSGEWYEASENYAGSSGEIIITKNNLISRTIEGTFSGLAVNINNSSDTKKAMHGSFAVAY